jgi:Ca2+-binding RTX toxin-like protein
MGFAFNVFVMNADGSGAASISGGTLDDGPAFSPDGTRIAARRVVAMGPENEFDIVTLNAAGGGDVDLTAGLLGEAGPSWEYVYNCAGRRATIVGSDSKDKIKGTKKADVIVSNGGKDRIRGRGGNDRICGGRGKDTLIGGAGKDRLLGGKGKDKVVQ